MATRDTRMDKKFGTRPSLNSFFPDFIHFEDCSQLVTGRLESLRQPPDDTEDSMVITIT